MSLLNDALRDLERRDADHRAPLDAVPAGLRGAAAAPRFRLPALVALALLMLAGGAYFSQVWLGKEARAAVVRVPGAAAQPGTVEPADAAAPVRPAPVAAASRSKPEPIVEASVPARVAPAREVLGSVVAPQEPKETRVVASPAAGAAQAIGAGQPAEPQTAPPADSTYAAHTQLNDPAQAEAPAVTATTPGQAAGSPDAGPGAIKQLPQSAAARDERLVPKLERLLVEGREREAALALEAAVAEGLPVPRSHGAMAKYYLAQERLAEARRWLPRALVARELDLRLLQGRLVLLEDGPKAALDYLAAVRPKASEAPDYVATLAALYQQAGQYAAAGKQWIALLEANSQRADWWLGLALALDAQDQLNGARMAYTEALALPELSPRLRTFAQSRLDSLL